MGEATTLRPRLLLANRSHVYRTWPASHNATTPTPMPPRHSTLAHLYFLPELTVACTAARLRHPRTPA